MDLSWHSKEINNDGFTIIDNIFSHNEVNDIIAVIDGVKTSGDAFRKSDDLFAIRQFLKEVPDTLPLLLNDRLKEVITSVFGPDYFIVKSIYFDKPGASNWFVAYHQDLTISVDRKIQIEGFSP